jgi:DNA-binding NtrC family response regulator
MSMRKVNKTILLLSPEAVTRRVLCEALENAGYLVLATGSLGTAVDVIESCHTDLLITHPYVDGISGQDAAKYLRARLPGLKVLLVAGFVDDDRVGYPAELEQFERFPGPFDIAALIEKVRAIFTGIEEKNRIRVKPASVLASARDTHDSLVS